MDTAARQHRNSFLADEPRSSLGSVSCILIFGRKENERPLELLMEGSEHEREPRLRHACRGRECLDEFLEAFGVAQLRDERMQDRQVHDKRPNQGFGECHGTPVMVGEAAAERAVVPLRRNRDFILLQVGQALSTVGSQASAIAYTLLVLELTGSAAKAGLASFAQLAPYAIFALPAGVAVDRFNRKWLMIWADIVRVLALGSLGITIATGHVTFVQILVVAFIEGTSFVIFNIAEIGAVRSVVPAPQLQRAFATEQARLSAVYLVGPALGGALFGIARSLPFVVDAISYAFSTGTLLAMRTPFQEVREERETAGLWTQIKEGLAWLWQHPFLRTCALLFVGGNFLYGAVYLLIIVAAERQGLSSSRIGLLVAILGVASVLGSVAAPRFLKLLPMRAVLVLSSWLAVGMVAFVAEPNVYVLVIGLVPLYIFNPTVNAMVIGYRVALVPDRLQGRVNSVARSVALLAYPLGPLTAGLLLASYSARAVAVVVLAGFLLLAVITTVNRSIRSAPSFEEVTAGAVS
jgi:MFS family permease